MTTLVDRRIPAPNPIFLIGAIWFVSFATFNLPERESPVSVAGLDLLALLKVGIRGSFLVLIGWTVVSYLRLESARRLMAIFLPLCLFVIWALISTLWSPLKSVSLGQSMGQLLLLGLSVCVALSCREPKYESRILFHLCAMFLALSFLAVFLHFVFPEWGSLSRDRYVGLYHPTNIASAASLGLLVLLACGLSLKQSWAPWLMFAGVLVHVVALWLASNRTSLLLDVPICMCIVLFYGNRIAIASLTFAACLGLCLFLLVDPSFDSVSSFLNIGADYVSRGQSAEQLSGLSGREEMWQAIWNSYLESPIIGHGFFVSSHSGSLEVWFVEHNHTAHNMILQALVSTGLIGLILIVWWGVRLVRLSLSPGIGTDRRYCAIFVPVFIWFFIWSLLNAAFLGPVRPESVGYAVIVGLFVSRVTAVKINARSNDDETHFD